MQNKEDRIIMGNIFEKNVFLLMQNKIVYETPKELNKEEAKAALDIVLSLIDNISYDAYSNYDYLQMARLYFNAAELSYYTGTARETVIEYYRSALNFLMEGGFDLSLWKWAELFNAKLDKYIYQSI